MGMTQTRHLPAEDSTFWCDRRTPHTAHTFTVGSGYGPTYEGRTETCPGLSPEEAFDNHTCADPGCPCSPKQGVSGETAAQHQDRVTAHDVDQHGDHQ